MRSFRIFESQCESPPEHYDEVLSNLVSGEGFFTEVFKSRKLEEKQNISGGDALRGHTRSHPEHDG